MHLACSTSYTTLVYQPEDVTTNKTLKGGFGGGHLGRELTKLATKMSEAMKDASVPPSGQFSLEHALPAVGAGVRKSLSRATNCKVFPPVVSPQRHPHSFPVPPS